MDRIYRENADCQRKLSETFERRIAAFLHHGGDFVLGDILIIENRNQFLIIEKVRVALVKLAARRPIAKFAAVSEKDFDGIVTRKDGSAVFEGDGRGEE